MRAARVHHASGRFDGRVVAGGVTMVSVAGRLDLGYLEDRNVEFEFRSAEGNSDRLSGLAS
jgi:hypothetical protein